MAKSKRKSHPLSKLVDWLVRRRKHLSQKWDDFIDDLPTPEDSPAPANLDDPTPTVEPANDDSSVEEPLPLLPPRDAKPLTEQEKEMLKIRGRLKHVTASSTEGKVDSRGVSSSSLNDQVARLRHVNPPVEKKPVYIPERRGKDRDEWDDDPEWQDEKPFTPAEVNRVTSELPGRKRAGMSATYEGVNSISALDSDMRSAILKRRHALVASDDEDDETSSGFGYIRRRKRIRNETEEERKARMAYVRSFIKKG